MQTPVEMDLMNKSPIGQEDSKKNEKLKMLDITRDKPIKVAVKVAVPVKDHPKFNFVGKLLGPKGNSMKRLQEDTMCKMAVLGRGSMRDRKKEEELRGSGEAKYAHLFEDLHVEISTFAAPAEAHARIAYALAEVRRFLVPDYHDDIRQEQMWEMQALTSTPSTNNMTGDQNSPTNSVDMDITTDDKNPVSPSNNRNSNSCSPTTTTTQINSNDNENMILKQQQHQQQQLQLQQQIQQQQQQHDDMDLTTADNSASNKLTDTSQIISTSTASLIPTHITQSQSMLSANPSKPTFPAIQHHLTNLMKPTSGLQQTGQQTATSCLSLPIPNDNDTAQPALTLIENPLMHPALRGVKSINIAGNMGRKRPLLGVPRSGMNPTKRTVMTLLARAKHSQSLHPNRNGTTGGFAEFLNAPLQMLAASPYILPPQPMDEALMALSKESITQGV